MSDPHFPYKESSLDVLTSLCEQKEIDLHFSVGEALSCIACGLYCDLACNPWDYTLIEEIPSNLIAMETDHIFIKTLKTVINYNSSNVSPRIKQVNTFYEIVMD